MGLLSTNDSHHTITKPYNVSILIISAPQSEVLGGISSYMHHHKAVCKSSDTNGNFFKLYYTYFFPIITYVRIDVTFTRIPFVSNLGCGTIKSCAT